jgi:hypothetical protein
MTCHCVVNSKLKKDHHLSPFFFFFFLMNKIFYKQTQKNYNTPEIGEEPQNTLQQSAKNKNQTRVKLHQDYSNHKAESCLSIGDLLNFWVITLVLISNLIQATKASSVNGELPKQSSFLNLQMW